MLKTNLVIKDIRELKRGAFRLGVITPILTDSEKETMRKAKGWKFKAELVPVENQNDIVFESNKGVEIRSKSQILRFAINELWVNKGQQGDPEEFYNKVMDSFIKLIKEKQ